MTAIRNRLPERLAALTRRVDIRILAAMLLLALFGWAFLKIASEMSEGDTLAFDRRVLLALRVPGHPDLPIGPAWLARAMVDLTALGGMLVLGLVTLLVTFYLVALRKWRTAAFLFASVASGILVGNLLKALFARARPELVTHLVVANTASFPSGHALNSAVTYLTLGSLLARTEDSRRVRIYIISVAVLLSLAIGASRVFLGVHWPSDVIAGWAVGAAWAITCSLAAQGVKGFAARRGDGSES